MSSKLLVITGPTATGKSRLGIELAKKYSGEIINGDSVSIYRHLDIGSAKTMKAEMDGVIHHLIDEKMPEEDYSVAQFQKEARNKIREIQNRGHLPIVVGGTGLYLKALIYDYEFPDNAENEDDFAEETDEVLYEKLRTVDPVSAAKIHPHNRRRIVRALQIASSGTTKSAQEDTQQHQMLYDALIIGLTMDRNELKKRISIRVDQMMAAGLETEAAELFRKYPADLRPLRSIGYREFVPYLKGEVTIEQTVNDIKTHTWQFAKRQYTWFRHQMPVYWADTGKENWQEDITREIECWLSRV